MDSRQEAQEMINQHGQRAQQVAVDSIVAAIRSGDDIEAARRGGVLRAIDLLVREGRTLTNKVGKDIRS